MRHPRRESVRVQAHCSSTHAHAVRIFLALAQSFCLSLVPPKAAIRAWAQAAGYSERITRAPGARDPQRMRHVRGHVPSPQLRASGEVLTFNVMDNSTLVFVATLVVAFVFLRWLIAPIPQSVPAEFNLPDLEVTAQNTLASRPSSRVRNRPVTASMIEVVQAIGPQLTVSQITYSLQRTGSVEASVEEYMENGTLPFPPGETPVVAQAHNVKPAGEPKTLLEKYGLSESEAVSEEAIAGKWGKDKSERVLLLQKRREEMILRARKRMETSLTNDFSEKLADV